MKMKLDLHGVSFECEKSPMSEQRFKAMCLLAAAGMYVGLVISVTSICGFHGLVAMAIATVLSVAIVKGI